MEPESFSGASVLTTTSSVGQELREPEGKYARLTNSQQRKLVGAYDKWARETERLLLTARERGANANQLRTILAARTPLLEIELRAVANAGTITGAAAGVPRALRELPSVRGITLALQANNYRLIKDGLIPGILSNLSDKLTAGAALDKVALRTAFDGLRHRPASYAGGAWVAIFQTQQAAGRALEKEQGEPQRVLWKLDPEAQHCQAATDTYGCPELAHEYDSWSQLLTVPAGRVTCRGNCRCELFVWLNGAWQRGLV